MAFVDFRCGQPNDQILNLSRDLLKPDEVFDAHSEIHNIDSYEILNKISNKIGLFTKFVYLGLLVMVYPAMSFNGSFESDTNSDAVGVLNLFSLIAMLIYIIFFYLNYQLRTIGLKLKLAAKPLESLIKDL